MTTKTTNAKKPSAKAVAEARATKHSVRAGGKEYGSVFKAFEALNLPMGSHTGFRKKLKAAGRLTFETGKRKVTFSIVTKKSA